MSSPYPATNPFSTQFWTPGALPYEFDDETVDVATLAKRFFAVRNHRGMAQIVGPHGSGKSTLVENLAGIFETEHFTVVHATLNDRRRKVPKNFWPHSQKAVFFLDGYEQLSPFAQARIRLQPWIRAVGLILTTHTPARSVPVLYETVPTFEHFYNLVARLTAGTGFSVTKETLAEIFQRHQGHFRNAFFELYDRYENRMDGCATIDVGVALRYTAVR